MSNVLCLHRGGELVDRQRLAEVITPPATDSHYPIPHINFLEQTQRSLLERGYKIDYEEHALARSGNHYFGLLQVSNDNIAKDYGVVIGLRNTHDKVFAAGLVLGTRVFVCDNLAFSGEVKLQRAHTKYIERDLPMVVARATGQLAESRIKQDQRIERYKSTEISNALADHLIVQMIREGIVIPSKAGDLVKEWDRPSHEEFAETRSVWRLFNATTEVLKGNILALPKRTTALHGLMDGVVEAEWREAA